MQPRDKDYIQTEEDLIFAVLGYEHPPEYVVCMLKAIAGKKWTASYPETIAFLSERYPQYVIRRCDIPQIIVPQRRVVRHWRPVWGLLPWRQNRSQLHELQRMTLELADVLAGETQIPPEHFAVVDSLLWGGERADSDIDLVVGSADSMQAVMRFLQQPWHDPFRRFTAADYVNSTRLDTAAFEAYCQRKRNLGYFHQVRFSVRAIRTAAECNQPGLWPSPPMLGDRTSDIISCAETITGTVQDNRQAWFFPATYVLDRGRIVQSFDMQYEGIFEIGEHLRVNGHRETCGEAVRWVVSGPEETINIDRLPSCEI